MARAITDPERISELLERGVEQVYPSRELLTKKLMSGDRIRLYCGFDPSATSLHIGNAISLKKLGEFQKLGHEVIFLIGDFTGMIGDPTDKSAARKQLTRAEVLHNAKNYKKQASAYLNFSGQNAAKIKYNSRWNDKLKFADLIKLASNFTVQYMIQRDMFQERLKEERPIYLHEFFYPLTQGYDSVAMDVDMEVGGNDQMFNMMCGRDLLKALKGKEKFVLTMKLLADETGKKMGKSEGNVINLDETPDNMYGIVMSWPDGILSSAFELCTNLELKEVKKIQADIKSGQANPRDLKMRLALEITKINHGEAKAQAAQEHFIKTVQNKEMPDEIPTYHAKANQMNVLDLLVASKLTASKGEAKRLIEQSGIKMKTQTTDFEVINSPSLEINLQTEIILQRGKRQFVKVIK
ncbi:MAG TPA: tyrosine--tRNA ligase [bacterium]|nr:tyrosine--tRNA ligase [bacterium]HPT29392.1 tyrosine--tRNA ligase [bacterium]